MGMSDGPKLGEFPNASQERDAVHVAIIPVVAKRDLVPGEHVKPSDVSHPDLIEDGDELIGFVDPVLFKKVKKIKKDRVFWLCLYPGSIISLRHDFDHPAFARSSQPDVSKMAEAKQWLTCYAHTLRASYEELLSHTGDYLKYGSRWSEGSRFDGEDLPDEFWDHYETVTGETVKDDDRNNFFSCSC